MTQPTGFSVPLSMPRRFVCDMLRSAKDVPSVPVERRMHLAPLVAARAGAAPRPGWCPIFTKAWAVVCGRTPALRRSYLGGPFPRIYEHPVSVASIAVERRHDGEDGVFFEQVREPDARSIAEIDARLRRFKEAAPAELSTVRRMARLCALPGPLRRAAWWIGLNASGRYRAKMFGTFGVSVYASLGASSLHPLSVLTTTLNYGPFDADGSLDVRVVYDHRVMDGGTVARALADLEAVLNGEMARELAALRAPAAAAG